MSNIIEAVNSYVNAADANKKSDKITPIKTFAGVTFDPAVGRGQLAGSYNNSYYVHTSENSNKPIIALPEGFSLLTKAAKKVIFEHTLDKGPLSYDEFIAIPRGGNLDAKQKKDYWSWYLATLDYNYLQGNLEFSSAGYKDSKLYDSSSDALFQADLKNELAVTKELVNKSIRSDLKNTIGTGLIDPDTDAPGAPDAPDIPNDGDTDLNIEDGSEYTPSEDTSANYHDAAFNDYWNNLYSMQPGTLGYDMVNRFQKGIVDGADTELAMQDAMYQQNALQQAQIVKSITDKIKSERMARLKAGMSESQIAAQDMQMLMTNVNAINEDTRMLNQSRLQLQGAKQNAQNDAYNQYLQSIQGVGQNAAAMYASDTANPILTSLQYDYNKNKNPRLANIYPVVTGQTKTGG